MSKGIYTYLELREALGWHAFYEKMGYARSILVNLCDDTKCSCKGI